jgi:hypothetical protein
MNSIVDSFYEAEKEVFIMNSEKNKSKLKIMEITS